MVVAPMDVEPGVSRVTLVVRTRRMPSTARLGTVDEGLCRFPIMKIGVMPEAR